MVALAIEKAVSVSPQEIPAPAKRQDSVKGVNASAAEAVLHRGGDGVAWKGVTIKLVGTWSSADCLEVNGKRPDIRRNGCVTIPTGENAGTYSFQVQRNEPVPHSAIVRITRSSVS